MHDLAESQSINHSPLMNKKRKKENQSFKGTNTQFLWHSFSFLLVFLWFFEL